MDVKNCKPMKEQVSDYIIYDILLRLPAESLMRLRSVSKNWRDIIDSLSFANKRLSTRAAAADEEPHILLVDHEHTVHSFTSDSNTIKEMPILEFSEECNAVENIANGLLFFRNKWNLGEFFICNPLRGQVLEIPQPLAVSTGMGTFREHLAFYGMGLDCTTNSYKIVRVCELPRFGLSRRLPRSKVETEVYTLGTASWRVISSSVCFAPHCLQSVSACGDMHWLIWDRRTDEARIVSFDFKIEKFFETPLPDFGCPREHYTKFMLIDLKGFLAIVSFPSATHIEIWVLRDYENKEWVKKYRSSTQVWAREADENTGVIRPDICFWEDKKISVGVFYRGLLFEAYARKQLFFLDIETNCLWCMQCPLPESYKFHKSLFGYTGNILSLRYFGNPIAEVSDKYNFLKMARSVYLTPHNTTVCISQ